ncbi:MAG: amino acid ABC transporter permease [Anaerolineales bacterium]
MATSPVPASERPPVASVGVLGWLRQNLFSSVGNTLLTIVSAAFLFLAGRSILTWAVTQANWGAVTGNLEVLTWGRYPEGQVWRLGLSVLILAVLGGLTWWLWRRGPESPARRSLLVGWALSPVALAVLIRGITLPTPATISNNLGYYLFRPEVLPLLEENWRAGAACIVVGLLGGITWSYLTNRTHFLGLAACSLMLLFLLPLGLQMEPWLFGLNVPIIVPLAVNILLAFLIGSAVGRSLSSIEGLRRWLPWIWGVTLILVVILLTTFDVGVARVAPVQALPIIPPNIWSGIMLTLMLAVVSIVASFPIGVLLALGRRSELPVVRGFCILFIELVRGVPLITILFMAQVMLPLFLPLELTIDRGVRAMAGMTLFTAAYLAEIVRGGLQAVRHEQVEAARALGLSEVLVTVLIVLPQALRAVIPPIMGQFVSIFKDTSLVAIVGLLDLLAVGQSVIKQREYLGAVREIYLFAGLFYFVVSYAMSLASRHLEVQLGVVDS